MNTLIWIALLAYQFAFLLVLDAKTNLQLLSANKLHHVNSDGDLFRIQFVNHSGFEPTQNFLEMTFDKQTLELTHETVLKVSLPCSPIPLTSSTHYCFFQDKKDNKANLQLAFIKNLKSVQKILIFQSESPDFNYPKVAAHLWVDNICHVVFYDIRALFLAAFNFNGDIPIMEYDFDLSQHIRGNPDPMAITFINSYENTLFLFSHDTYKTSDGESDKVFCHKFNTLTKEIAKELYLPSYSSYFEILRGRENFYVLQTIQSSKIHTLWSFNQTKRLYF